jgi:hypothetical protein
LWTDTALNFGHVAGRTPQGCGLKEATVGSQADLFRNPIRERTTVFDARRVLAIDAAARLRTCRGFIVQAVNAVNVTNALIGTAFWRKLTRNITPVVFFAGQLAAAVSICSNDPTRRDVACAAVGKCCALIDCPTALKINFLAPRLASGRAGEICGFLP